MFKSSSLILYISQKTLLYRNIGNFVLIGSYGQSRAPVIRHILRLCKAFILMAFLHGIQ
jgi:hypothetical protein